MQVKDQYDLIVVGNQIGGYVLALSAQRRGLKVLVIEARPRPSTIYDKNQNNAFQIDVLWEPVMGLAPGSKEAKFLHQLGVYDNWENLCQEFDPPVQMVNNRYRIDFSYPLTKMDAQWLREDPKQAAKLSLLAQKISNSQSKQTQTYQELVDSVGLASSWSQFGDVHAPLVGSVAPKSITNNLLRRYMQDAHKGVGYLVGGKDAFKNVLRSKLLEAGGQIKHNSWVEQLVFERSKLAGVLLSSFEGFVRSRYIVGNIFGRSFLNLLPKDRCPASLRQQADALKPQYWRFNFTVRLDKSLVPEALANHLCYFESEHSLSAGQFFQLFRLPPNSYPGIEDNKEVLLIRCLVPYMERAIHLEYIRNTMRRCLKNLTSFIPLFDIQQAEVIPNPDNLAQELLVKDYYQFETLDDIPHDFIVYGQTADPHGISGMKSNWAKYGLPGLGLCSRDVRPAEGLVGDIRSAMELNAQLRI